MASNHLFPAVLLAAMFLGADGAVTGSLPDEELQQRCRDNSTAIFAHPGECQLYYNCSNAKIPSPFRNSLTQYMEECPYPKLFSKTTSRCEPFDDVTCGCRKEPINCDEYHRLKCYSHCRPCYADLPYCKDLPDGINVYKFREWSPYYVVCRSQRPAQTGRCPVHKTLEITQLLHKDKGRCVSLYEIPREHHGEEMSCTHKADGLYLDDVTNRPDVYYQCHKEELVDVDKCAERGTYFDELLLMCAKTPLKNRIIYRNRNSQ